MASQDWSIMIVPSQGAVGFQPDVPNSKVGDPLEAQDADIISWNNRTSDKHWPWAIDPTTGQPYPTVAAAKAASMYLSEEIEPWQSSADAFITTAPQTGSTTIDYICHDHPDDPSEKGQIIVWATV